jgi:imidazolonepropionase-like amidohydrolase
VIDAPNHRELVYELGRNPVAAVVKSGRVVHSAAPGPRR